MANKANFLNSMPQEDFYKLVFDNAAVAMSITAPNGRWIRLNRAYPKMFGYTKAQLKKMSFVDITHPDDRKLDEINVARLLKGEIKEYNREKRYIHKDGSTIYALIRVTLMRDQAGQPQYIVAVLQNITKRKLMEERIQISEIRYRT